jgi:Carboxypeptidase regulatory-like domain
MFAALALGAAPGAAQTHPGGVSAGDTLATAYGTVVEHASGAPLAQATVSLASGPGGTRGIGTRITNQQGGFLFQAVPPGTYTLVVSLMGYLTRRDTIRVAGGGGVRIRAELSMSLVPLDPSIPSWWSCVGSPRGPWRALSDVGRSRPGPSLPASRSRRPTRPCPTSCARCPGLR